VAQTYQLKNRKRFFVSFNTIYTPAPSMLQKIGLPQMFAKNYFGNTGAQLRDRWPCISNLKILSFVGLIGIIAI